VVVTARGTTPAETRDADVRRRSPRRRTRWIGLAFAALPLGIYALVVLVPLAQSVQYSFYKWDGVSASTWAGLDNYRTFLTDPVLRSTFLAVLVLIGFFALLPIAVVIGVAIGRSGSNEGDNEALLKALQERQATADSTVTGPTGATAAATPKAAKKKAAKADKSNAKPKEKVVAHTSNGEVHEVTDFHASEQKEAEDTHLVEENPEQTGKNYIKAQQNLPDVIVVGGEGGSAPSSSGGEP